MEKISRRDFLKRAGKAGVVLGISTLGLSQEGCGVDQSNPESVAKEYTQAILNNEYDKALAQVAPDRKQSLLQRERFGLNWVKEDLQKFSNCQNAKISAVVFRQTSLIFGVVTLLFETPCSYSPPSSTLKISGFNIQTEKIKERWYVALTTARLSP